MPDAPSRGGSRRGARPPAAGARPPAPGRHPSRGRPPSRGIGGIARRLAAAAALAVLVASLVAPAASADTIRRTWTARLGGGANGTAKVVAYTGGTGLLSLALTGLQPSTIYPVLVYRGTCAAPSIVTRLPGFRTDPAGAIAKSSALGVTYMNSIWTYGRTGAIALKVGTGSLAKCAALTYPTATRVAITALGIDLPVIRAPSGYPRCNVAMFIRELSQPRESGVTLLYAHARTGMFLPLLTRSKVGDGASLIGMRVKVWTSDDVLSTYQIVRVRRHVTTLDGVFGITSEQLWLQTSEGPRGTTQKLIVVAKRLSSVASTHAAAHPTPHPVVCG